MRGKRADERPDASVPDPAYPLRNPRHEKFTQLCASGIKPAEAYISVGYAEGGAPQAAGNLLGRTDVRSRLDWIMQQSAVSTATQVAFNQERVLNRLDVISRKAEDLGQMTAAARCEELIGKQHGMFRDGVDHKFQWDGDITKLTTAQQIKLMQSLEVLIFKGDAEAKARAEAEVLREIDAPAAGAVQ